MIVHDILECEASSPLAMATSTVPLHAIAHGEIVPRTNESHGLDRGLRLKHECNESCCRVHCAERQETTARVSGFGIQAL